MIFVADPKVYDGRFANNGWLQELPDALTKITWDNAAFISPSTAKAISVSHGDMLRFDHDGRSVEAVAFVLPGQAPNTATLPLGYGRTVSGQVGTEVGFNVYPLRSSSTMNYARGVSVTKTGARHDLFATQDHFPIDPKGEASRQTRLSSFGSRGVARRLSARPSPAPRPPSRTYSALAGAQLRP